MKKEYALINPDIDSGSGRTRELIDELARSWREGKNEGGGEISALIDLLTLESLPDVLFRLTTDGPIQSLSRSFLDFLNKGFPAQDPFVQRVLKVRGLEKPQIGVIGVGNATGGLWAAMMALGVAGGEVITTSLNYVGVLNAIMMAGATPHFVDVDEKTWCIDPDEVGRAINKNTKAIVITHLNNFVDLEPFYEMIEARGREIPLIQDASLAIGSRRKGLRPGVLNIGKRGVTVFSLTVSKIITGLGGALVTSHDQALLEQIATTAYQGVSFSKPGVLDDFGANFKMSALNAVVAMEKLKQSDKIFDRRRKLRELYDKNLAALAGKGLCTPQQLDPETVVTHYGVLLPGRDQVAKELNKRYGINLGVWHVHHLQQIYRNYLKEGIRKLPRSENIAPMIAFLPFHTKLSDADVGFICRAIDDVVGSAGSPGPKRRAIAGKIKKRSS